MVEDNEQEAFDVALADRLTAVLGQVTVRPEGVALPVKVTVPVKPKMLVRLTFTERPVSPTFRLAPMTEIVKSPT